MNKENFESVFGIWSCLWVEFVFTCSAIDGFSRSFFVVGGVWELSGLPSSSSSSSSLPRFEPALKSHKRTQDNTGMSVNSLTAANSAWSYENVKKCFMVMC